MFNIMSHFLDLATQNTMKLSAILVNYLEPLQPFRDWSQMIYISLKASLLFQRKIQLNLKVQQVGCVDMQK